MEQNQVERGVHVSEYKVFSIENDANENSQETYSTQYSSRNFLEGSNTLINDQLEIKGGKRVSKITNTTYRQLFSSV